MQEDSVQIRRRLTRRREDPEAHEINITPVMNLFICLIPFLLISAVFLQISIIETDAPAVGNASGGKATSMVMVVVRRDSFVLSAVGPIANGDKKSLRIAKKGKDYDFDTLKKRLIVLKANDPKATELLLLSAPDIPYSSLIDVMDAARDNDEGVPLFPNAFFGGVTS